MKETWPQCPQWCTSSMLACGAEGLGAIPSCGPFLGVGCEAIRNQTTTKKQVTTKNTSRRTQNAEEQKMSKNEMREERNRKEGEGKQWEVKQWDDEQQQWNRELYKRREQEDCDDALRMVRFKSDKVATVPYIDTMCNIQGVTPDAQLVVGERSALFDQTPSRLRIAQGVHQRT
jgi:hypothetical protein